MSTTSRSLVRLVASAMIAFALAGCGRTEGYRYKLTLAVNTPEGVKRASSVGQVWFWDYSFPERGIGHKLRGEALYLDLGPDRRPLIALLTRTIHPWHRDESVRWSTEAGPGTRLMCRLYGIVPSADNFRADVPHIARLRGPHSITPNELPDLVTFADVNDPNTVIEVDPNDLEATLSPGVSWNEITLESTDEPITSGIRTKLPWLPAYFQKNLRLDGSDHGIKSDLANRLSWFEFDQSGALKRNPCDRTKADNICSPSQPVILRSSQVAQ